MRRSLPLNLTNSINNSSVPFRALLGAILSVVNKVPVEPSEFDPDMKLDTVAEEQDEL